MYTGTSGVICLLLAWLHCAAPDEILDKYGELEDICQWEQLNAECQPDEAIIIEQAIYGRMKYGRCISRDYGYIGCYTDVRMLADMRCSGRPRCTINVPDKLFDGTTPACPDDLKLYMSARYKCVKVIVPPLRKCTDSVTGQPPLVTAPDGYISSYVTNQTGCGSANAPWRISLQPGQRINITLLDFSNPTFGRGNKSRIEHSHCRVFAIIKDPMLGTVQSKTICAEDQNPGQRERHLLTTEGNEAEIRLMSVPSFFMLKYEALGCPDLPSTGGRWFKRNDRKPDLEAEAGCEEDRTKWRLTCNGHAWEGPSQNCTSPVLAAGTYGSPDSIIPKSTAFLIVIGIAVFIGFCILAIGVFIIKRQRYASSHPPANAHPQCPMNKMATSPKHGAHITREAAYMVHPPLLVNDTLYADENEYAYVEEYQSISSPISHGKSNTFASGPCPQHPGYTAHAHLPIQTGPGNQDVSGPMPPALPPTEYNSLGDSGYRFRSGYTQVSPGGGAVHHPYHVLDLKDGQTKRGDTELV